MRDDWNERTHLRERVTERDYRNERPSADVPHPSPGALRRADREEALAPEHVVSAEPPAGPRGHYYAYHAEPERPFSIGATFLGWSVASFFGFAFLGLLALVLGGTVAALNVDVLTPRGLVSSFGAVAGVGVLVVAFFAYLIGGYAAGRIALWDGAKHGALTVAWAVLFTVLGSFVALVAGAELFNLTPLLPETSPEALTLAGILFVALLLVAMIGGGALGGRMGERVREPDKHFVERARRTRTRTL